MGMFNTVLVPCPRCGKEAEFQSKGGTCRMEEYRLHDAPVADAAYLTGVPFTCTGCRTPFEVRVQHIATTRLRHPIPLDDE